MKLLGIRLHWPNNRDRQLLVGIVAILLVTVVISTYLNSTQAGVCSSLVFGIVGGAIAASMGASISRYGFRALVIVLSFTASFVGLARGIAKLTSTILGS